VKNNLIFFKRANAAWHERERDKECKRKCLLRSIFKKKKPFKRDILLENCFTGIEETVCSGERKIHAACDIFI